MRKLSIGIITLLLTLGFVQSSFAKGSIEAGKAKSIHCQVCHGKGGKSFDPQYPVLAGQHAQYIVKQLKAFQAKERTNPIMNEIAAPLTVQDMEDLGRFFQSNQ